MNDEERPLPTSAHVMKQYRQMRPLLKVAGLFSRELAQQAKALNEQFEDVQRMHREREERERQAALAAAHARFRGWSR